MNTLRPIARIYISLLAILTVIVTVATSTRVDWTSVEILALAAVFAALVALAAGFSVHFAFKSKLSLETSVLFAGIILFDPGLAILIALIGSVCGDLITRRPRIEIVFNAAQLALQTAAAAFILQAAGWDPGNPNFASVWNLLAIVGAVATMTMLNFTMVILVISFQSGLPPQTLVRDVAQFDLIEHATQFGLGLLGAVIVADYPWTLVILVLLALSVFRSSQRNIQMRSQAIEALARLADAVDLRDPYTANHSRRVGVYARELAVALKLSPDEIDLIERAGRVHDIGKIIVDLGVLTKTSRLDDNDWAQLKEHPVTGAEVLSRFPEFTHVTAYVRHHHESMDGTGYPDGLVGDAIPFGARIIAVADSFDAMASARPYRAALSRDIVLAEFAKKRGIQWDEQVVDALFELIDEGRITFPNNATIAYLYDRNGAHVPLPAAI